MKAFKRGGGGEETSCNIIWKCECTAAVHTVPTYLHIIIRCKISKCLKYLGHGSC